MSETPLHFKTITDLAALIKSKSLSPVEVTEAMLSRIQEQDPQYRSYATVTAEQARASAQAAERAIAAGNYLNQSQGGMCIYDGRGIGLGFSQKSFGP